MGKDIRRKLVLETEFDVKNAQNAAKSVQDAFNKVGLNVDGTKVGKILKDINETSSKLQNQNGITLNVGNGGEVNKILRLYQQLEDELRNIGVELRDLGNLSDKEIINLFGSNQLKNAQKAQEIISSFKEEYQESAKQAQAMNLELEKTKQEQEKINKLIKEYNNLENQKQTNKKNAGITTKSGDTQKTLSEEKARLSSKRQEKEDFIAENTIKLSNGKTRAKSGKAEEVKQARIEVENLTKAEQACDQQLKILTDGGYQGLGKMGQAATQTSNRVKLLEDDLANISKIDLSKVFDKLAKNGIDLGIDPKSITSIEQLEEAASKLSKDELASLKIALQEVAKESLITGEAAKNTSNSMDTLGKSIKDIDDRAKNLEGIKSAIERFTGLAAASYALKSALRSAYQTISELDKSITEQAVVTDQTVSEIWNKLPEMTKEASALGVTIKDVYDAQTLYYQQGLKDAEVTALTTSTLKMARIAGLDASEATDRMTNALRGFNMELNETSAERVADVYSKLAAVSATDVDELSTAMTKTASIASSAGMSFENTSAYLAQMLETTRESAETAGTALKTVIGRFTEVKSLYSKGQLSGQDEEGEIIDVNKISAALRTAGIDMNKFFTGEVGLDEIFNELAAKWDSLSIVQQRYIATQAAGSRQQSRFIAMLGDQNRLTELQSYAYNSAGASQEQYEKTLESLESKLNQLKDAWDTFTTGILNSKIIKGLVDLGTQVLTLANNISTLGGALENDNFFSGLLKLAEVAGLFAGGKMLLNFAVDNTSDETLQQLNALLHGDFKKYKDEKEKKKQIKDGLNIGENTDQEEDKNPEVAVSESAPQVTETMRQATKDGAYQGTKEGIDQALAEAKGENFNSDSPINNTTDTDIDLPQTTNMNVPVDTGFQKPDIQWTQSQMPEKLEVPVVADSKDLQDKLQKELDQNPFETKFEPKNRNWIEDSIPNSVDIPLEPNKDTLKNNIQNLDVKLPIESEIKAPENMEFIKELVPPLEINADEQSFKNATKSVENLGNAISSAEQGTKQYTTAQGALGASLSKNNISTKLLTKSEQTKYRVTGMSTTTTGENTKKIGENTVARKANDAITNQQTDSIEDQTKELGDNTDAFSGNTKKQATDAVGDKVGDLLDGGGDSEPSGGATKVLDKIFKTKDTNPEEVGKYFSKISDYFVKGENGAVKWGDTLKKCFGDVKGGMSDLGGQAKNLFTTYSKYLPAIGKLLAGVALVVGTVVAQDMLHETAEEKLKSAQESAKLLSDAYSKASEEYSDLVSSTESYKDALLKTEELTAGTLEFADALQQSNSQALDLIDKYNLVAGQDWSFGENGEIVIDSKALEDKQREELDKTQKAQAASISANSAVKEAEYDKKEEDLLRDLKSTNGTLTSVGKVLASTAVGAGAGALTGSAFAGIGAIPGTVIGAIGGAIAGIVDVAQNGNVNAEQTELDGLVSAINSSTENQEAWTAAIAKYKSNGSEEELTAILKDVGITDQVLIDSIIENIDSVNELVQSNTTLTAAIKSNAIAGYSSYIAGSEEVTKAQEEGNGGLVEYLNTVGGLRSAEGSETYEAAKEEVQELWKGSNNDFWAAYLSEVLGDGSGDVSDYNTKGNQVAGSKYKIKNLGGDNVEVVTLNEDGSEGETVTLSESAAEKTLIQQRAYKKSSALQSEDVKEYNNIIDSLGNAGITDEKTKSKLAVSFGKAVNDDEIDAVDVSSLTRKEKEALENNLSEIDEKYQGVLKKGLEQYEQQRSLRTIQESAKWQEEYDNQAARTQRATEAYTEAGMDEASFNDYAAQLASSYGVASDVAEEMAIQNLKTTNSIVGLNKALEDNEDILNSINKDDVAGTLANPAAVTAINQLKSSLKSLTNVEFDSEYIIKNMDLVKKAADGDKEAIKELRKEAAKQIVIDADLKTDDANKLNDMIDDLSSQEITIGTSLDDTNYVNTLNQMLKDGQITVEDCNNILSNIGYTPDYDYIDVPGPTTTTSHEIKWGDYTVAKFDDISTSTMQVPQINGEGTTFSGVQTPSTPSSVKASSGSSSGSGSSKSWDNDFDWLENLLQQIEANTREMTQLQADMKDILEEPDEYTSGDLLENLRSQIQNLAQKRVLEEQKINNRQTELNDLFKQYPEVKDYFKQNEDGTFTIDYDAIEQLDKDDNSEMGGLLKDVFSQAKSAAEDINNSKATIENIDDEARSIKKQLKDVYVQTNQRVREALKAYMQAKIEEQKAVVEAIGEANTELIQSINEALSRERQLRENEKTEEEITDKEQRLAYLQMDTSGAHQGEIMSLQQEIEDEKESYTNTLIDQKISELEDQNNQAQEQRERQIKLMETQLTIMDETGVIAKQAEQILAGGIDKDGKIITGSSLETILMKQDNFSSLTQAEKDAWADDLKTQLLQTKTYIESCKDPDFFKVNDSKLATALEDYNKNIKSTLGSITNSISSLAERIDASNSGGSGSSGGGTDLPSSPAGSGGGSASYSKGAEVKWTNGIAGGNRTGNGTITKVDSSGSEAKYTIKDNTGKEFTVTESQMKQSGITVNGKSTVTATANYKSLESKENKLPYSTTTKDMKAKEIAFDKSGGKSKTFSKKGSLCGYSKLVGDSWAEFSTTADNTVLTINGKVQDTYYASRRAGGQVLYKVPVKWKNSTGEGTETPWLPGTWLYGKYEQGGLADFTGPAWLDGTKSKPEMVLNATDTENFIALKDILNSFLKSGTSTKENTGEMTNTFNIYVDEIADDYDVDQIVDRVKKDLYEIGSYRNVTQINRLR